MSIIFLPLGAVKESKLLYVKYSTSELKDISPKAQIGLTNILPNIALDMWWLCIGVESPSVQIVTARSNGIVLSFS